MARQGYDSLAQPHGRLSFQKRYRDPDVTNLVNSLYMINQMAADPAASLPGCFRNTSAAVLARVSRRYAGETVTLGCDQNA